VTRSSHRFKTGLLNCADCPESSLALGPFFILISDSYNMFGGHPHVNGMSRAYEINSLLENHLPVPSALARSYACACED
jgi:hypothetical protein